MRRQDIQLLAQARQGDTRARCEVGRRYLLGCDGFPLHVPSGLEHLRQAALTDAPAAARVVVEALPLHELLAQGQLPMLEMAAAAGHARARLRLAVWRAGQCAPAADAAGAADPGPAAPAAVVELLRQAAAGGLSVATRARVAFEGAAAPLRLRALLRTLDAEGEVDGLALARQLLAQAQAGGDVAALADALRAALAFAPATEAWLAQALADAVRLADGRPELLGGIDPAALREALELAALRDRDAAFALGRGLSGLPVPALAPAVFEGQQNMRKGAAFLLRAADAGCDEAWLVLYRLHADHSLSVANPQMARFFLEKAAARGQAEAQRKLGALALREAATLADTEQAIAWLAQAAGQGDTHAQGLLRSLVLPLPGRDAEADWGIAQLRASEPALAARLALARAFGLTKLEALCVDPVDGERPWGLVVGRNPFVVQARLSAPRAVPALDARAQEALRQAVAWFGQTPGGAAEGDHRARSLRQRRAFERLGLDESLYFADASTAALDALRLGAKWAWRTREPLAAALAA